MYFLYALYVYVVKNEHYIQYSAKFLFPDTQPFSLIVLKDTPNEKGRLRLY